LFKQKYIVDIFILNTTRCN